MDVIRIRKKIDSKDIHIDELEDFIGQEAEVIIFPVASEKKTNKKNLGKLVGSIKTGENPLKFQKRIRKEGG
ncbi:MAG: hypothetical protein R6V04_14835 [bacterium]